MLVFIKIGKFSMGVMIKGIKLAPLGLEVVFNGFAVIFSNSTDLRTFISLQRLGNRLAYIMVAWGTFTFTIRYRSPGRPFKLHLSRALKSSWWRLLLPPIYQMHMMG
jgi:hypothetical protein